MSDAVRTLGAQLPSRRRPRDPKAAMTADEVATQWAGCPAVSPQGGAIARRARSSHDLEAVAFATALASMVPCEGDDAGLKVVGDDRCDVCLSARSARATTGQDIICAAQAEAISAHRYGDAA